jgi:hypothetical protein
MPGLWARLAGNPDSPASVAVAVNDDRLFRWLCEGPGKEFNRNFWLQQQQMAFKANIHRVVPTMRGSYGKCKNHRQI